MSATALSPRAFLLLLLLAVMFGGNHVAARLAFNDGVDVATAVALRSGATTLYSEDMQHGRRFGSLTITNPFI